MFFDDVSSTDTVWENAALELVSRPEVDMAWEAFEAVERPLLSMLLVGSMILIQVGIKVGFGGDDEGLNASVLKAVEL